MGLRINTNVASLNAARTLQRSTSDLNKSLERLSSGLRINTAGDDAAGLSINRAADDAAGLAIADGFNSVVRERKSPSATRRMASASCRRRKVR